MLVELAVHDLGIIDELHVVFGEGLTAITGETGAGKTLLVEALGLLAGTRSASGLVRAGASQARVDGRFVDRVTGDETVLSRVVPVAGRSRAYVDGNLATAAELARLAAQHIDLHGQHAHQHLVAPAAQRAALDQFGGPPAATALAAYRAARMEVQGLRAELEALGGDERARAREVALLAHQIAEIDGAALAEPDEDEGLAREQDLLADADAHREALSSAYQATESTAVDAMGRAAAALGGRPALADHEARVRGLQVELVELARDLRAAAEAVDLDPGRLEEVQARRRALRELTRKYGADLGEVLDYRREAAERLAQLEAHEERSTRIAAQLDAARARQEEAGRTLRAVRRAAASEFSAAVEERLRRLAMPRARLSVEVEPDEPGEDGADRVTFLLSANVGEPALPLARVASGGELSRTGLALRSALVARAAPDPRAVPVLVFDEVDAGIGGEVGTAVGAELAGLAVDAQVLCVTHLAQVASFADAQLVVTKHDVDGRTIATAELVLGEARVEELSRMLAGVGSSTHARRHAAELLEERASRSSRGPA